MTVDLIWQEWKKYTFHLLVNSWTNETYTFSANEQEYIILCVEMV